MWQMKMFISGISSFTDTAERVAGAEFSSSNPWHTLLLAAMTINDRIDSGGAREHPL